MAIELCLDTNAYSAFLRSLPLAISLIEAAEHIWMPSPVLGELRAGFLKGSRSAANELALSEFLESKHVSVAPVGEATSRRYAQLFDNLRRAGTPIPINDVWIAACAIEQNCPLFTYDQHFRLIPQLTVIASEQDWLDMEKTQ